MTLDNSTYDKLKFIALVVLPALATLVVAVNPLWDIPNQDAIVGTIIAVDTFLGALLGLSSKQYNEAAENFDGYLDAEGEDPDTGHPNLNLVITKPPQDLLGGNQVRLRIGRPPS
jgi:hypothetical protein